MVYYLMIELSHKNESITNKLHNIAYSFNPTPLYYKGKWYAVAPFSSTDMYVDGIDFSGLNRNIYEGYSSDQDSPCIERTIRTIYKVNDWKIEFVLGYQEHPKPNTIYIWMIQSSPECVEIKTQIGHETMWDGVYSVHGNKRLHSILGNGHFREGIS